MLYEYVGVTVNGEESLLGVADTVEVAVALAKRALQRHEDLVYVKILHDDTPEPRLTVYQGWHHG